MWEIFCWARVGRFQSQKLIRWLVNISIIDWLDILKQFFIISALSKVYYFIFKWTNHIYAFKYQFRFVKMQTKIHQKVSTGHCVLFNYDFGHMQTCMFIKNHFEDCLENIICVYFSFYHSRWQNDTKRYFPDKTNKSCFHLKWYRLSATNATESATFIQSEK